MKERLHLKRTMNLIYAFAIIVPLIIISFLSMNYAKTYIIDVSKDSNEQVIRNTKQLIENFFEEPVRNLSILKELYNISDDNDKFELISTFYDAQENIDHFLLIDEDGTVEFTYPKDDAILGYDYSNEISFLKAMDNETDTWSETYMYSRENKISVNVSVKLDGKVLVAVIHLDIFKVLYTELVLDSDIILAVTDDVGNYMMHTDYSRVEQRVSDPHIMKGDYNYERLLLDDQGYFVTSLVTDYKGWRVIIYDPVNRIEERINRFILILSLIIVLLVSVTVLIGWKFNNGIFKNLKKVIFLTEAVRDGNYDTIKQPSRYVEFDEIQENFSAMVTEIKSREDQILHQKHEIETMNKDLESRVIGRTNELYSANQELGVTLTTLKQTQDQLIESEKLASLGDLVSGLAHEINTPLGIILTVASYMRETTMKVKGLYDTGMLKKSDFETHLNSSAESEELIYDNITRAIELISSFKLISAEQRNVEVREVDLHEFLTSILKSIEPQLKKAKIKSNLHIKEGISIVTIPISLYQVVVNLLMNAKIHAYNDKTGVVDIYVNEKEDGLEIIVQDYGAGIEPEHIKKIFDPFFTTKRGLGGTGLGLNIVYNTVKQDLKGEIKCYSENNVGSQFVISLPRSVNENDI
jgi:signal transduction histidine kinase